MIDCQKITAPLIVKLAFLPPLFPLIFYIFKSACRKKYSASQTITTDEDSSPLCKPFHNSLCMAFYQAVLLALGGAAAAKASPCSASRGGNSPPDAGSDADVRTTP